MHGGRCSLHLPQTHLLFAGVHEAQQVSGRLPESQRLDREHIICNSEGCWSAQSAPA